MEITILFSPKRVRLYWRPKCYAIYHYEMHAQELFTHRPGSTIRALIHEDVHQVIHEIEEGIASLEYDNVAKKLEKYLYGRC